MRHFQDLFDGRRTAEAIEKHRKHYKFWDDEKDLIRRLNYIESRVDDIYNDCN